MQNQTLAGLDLAIPVVIRVHSSYFFLRSSLLVFLVFSLSFSLSLFFLSPYLLSGYISMYLSKNEPLSVFVYPQRKLFGTNALLITTVFL